VVVLVEVEQVVLVDLVMVLEMMVVQGLLAVVTPLRVPVAVVVALAQMDHPQLPVLQVVQVVQDQQAFMHMDQQIQ
tara:strand:+ start:341 stop:568 length:228 start_codon:yes stop_codon:yes gene_type:complete